MVPFILTIVAGTLVSVLTFVARWLKVKLAPDQLGSVIQLAHSAVQAAEKFGADHGLAGPDKYTMASDVLKASARRVGFKLSDEEIAGLIHAALLAYDTTQQELQAYANIGKQYEAAVQQAQQEAA